MKMTTLRIRNMFGVAAYDSDGKNIELIGKNGAGKSAILDALKYGLTNKSERDFILLQGASEGEVFIEMDNGLSIHRKVRANKADYASIKQEGDKAPKTEGFIRQFFTELQLSPVEFAEMDAKEQNRIILDLIDFRWDTNWIKEQFGEIPQGINYEQNILSVLHDIQAENSPYFMKRQELNREARNKEACIEDIGKSLPEGYNASTWEAIDLAALYARIEAIRTKNSQIEAARTALAEKENKTKDFLISLNARNNDILNSSKASINELAKSIEDYKNKIAEAMAKMAEVEKIAGKDLELSDKEFHSNMATLDGEMKQHEEAAKGTIESIEELQAEAATVQKMKGHINECQRMVTLGQDAKKMVAESDALTAKIERARTLPGEILEKANIPIDGLTIKDGLPLINGLPISNLSEGERFELCISVATRNPADLQLVLIDGIERLATEKREKVYARLKEKGVQFIATRTTDDQELKVVEL